jgi:hypothetical protein
VIAQIPNTDQYVVAGTLAMIAKVLPADAPIPPLTAPAPLTDELPAILLDGHAVHQEITRHLGNSHCFSPVAVSTTLDAVVRLMRAERKSAAPAPQQSEMPHELLDAIAAEVKAAIEDANTGADTYMAALIAASKIEALTSTKAAPAAPAQTTVLTPLDYRAQGREEALAIILAESPEEPFSDYTHSYPIADTGDYGTEWYEPALRELLSIGDREHDAYDRAEAAYWESLGHKEEAERMKRMVERAPHFKPLLDYLSEKQEWGLLHLLQEAEVAAPVQAVTEQAQWISVDDRLPGVGEEVLIWCGYRICGYRSDDKNDPENHSGWVIDFDNGLAKAITHWMPLPVAPSTGEASKDGDNAASGSDARE